MSTLSDGPIVVIYTDGACDPNPGPGGWAALLRWGDREKRLHGSAPHTTNNRMELTAILEALRALKRPCRVRLHTDSKYAERGVTRHLAVWKAKAWQTTDKRSVANRDLWEAVDAAAARHEIEWLWVRGHAGDAGNEEVDRLAVAAIRRPDVPLGDPAAAHAFTAVSCLGPQGPGAWAVVVREGTEAPRVLTGREERTSANRLHLLAAARALAAARPGRALHVYTTSDYVARGAGLWASRWAARGFRTQEGAAVKHEDLWRELLAGSARGVVAWHALKDGLHPVETREAERHAREAARVPDSAEAR